MSLTTRWDDRIAAADSAQARRLLLGELGAWRARNLTDIPALRDAAFAMSRLHMLLGDTAAAAREGRSLLSLCQTPPEASKDELKAARAWLSSLGESGVVGPAPARPASSPDPVQRARDLAQNGRYGKALDALRGRRGGRTELLRTWILLNRAMQGDDRDRQLQQLEQRLREQVGGRRAPAAPVPARSEADKALADVLGVERVPRKRAVYVRLLETFAEENPDKLDVLASGALEHHVAIRGLKEPAPWLVGIVGRALAGGRAQKTRSTLEALQRRKAYAVTAYREWAFTRGVELMAQALRDGWDFIAFRRGVSRDEPANRKLWTLRLSREFQERMLVIGGPSGEAYGKKVGKRLASRLVELSPKLVLLAPGDGNTALREASAALGVRVLEEDASSEDVLGWLAGVEDVVPVVEKAAPSPMEVLKASFATGPTVEGLTPLVAQLDRAHRAFSVVRKGELDADKLAVLLEAVDAGAPPEVRLLEGTQLALLAAAGGSDACRALLERERYGGPGADTLVGIVAGVVGEGWELYRVLRGPTRRECRDHPALEPLAASMRNLWRLILNHGDARVELWFLAELPPEGRAGVPQLLLSERARVVVAPAEADTSWFTGGSVVGWDGTDAAPILTELSSRRTEPRST